MFDWENLFLFPVSVRLPFLKTPQKTLLKVGKFALNREYYTNVASQKGKIFSHLWPYAENLRKDGQLTSGNFSPQLALHRLTFLIKENKADASLGTP